MKNLVLLLLIISNQLVAQKELDEWWFTRKGHKRGCDIAKKNHLKDSVISISTGEMYLWLPKKYDSTKLNLIMIHGMGINGISQWQNQIEPFSEKFNLFIPDLMGYSNSIAKKVEYSPEYQVNSIHEALRKIGIKGKFNVAGFSYGGLVTATFHYLFENEVDKIAICDGPVKYFNSHIADSICKARNLDNFEYLISPRNKVEATQFFDATYSGSTYFRNRWTDKHMVKYVFLINQEIKRKQMDFLREFEKNYTNLDYHFNSSNVLFLWGGEDGAIPLFVGQNLANEYQKAKLVIIPKAKHDAHLKHKKVFNKALLEHFAQ
jgi:pimeloyl-ACP methyl ester carboxylesterase